jgi:hypothetical protein
VPQPETVTLRSLPAIYHAKELFLASNTPPRKSSRGRDRFLAEIDSVTPWSKPHKLVEPFYPKVVGAGRPPIGLARMLHMYVAAPPSTKNKDGKRGPEMHQSKKDNDRHFGMKAHIGVDAASGLVHTLVGTAGNVADVTQAHALLHGDEIRCARRRLLPGRGKAPRKSRQSGDVACRHEAL